MTNGRLAAARPFSVTEITTTGQEDTPPPRATDDRLLDGRLILRQPARGHRAGTDAVLLAAAVADRREALIIDIGAGVGTAGLAVALRHPESELVLIDDDPAVAAFARENLAANGLAARGRVVVFDVMDRAARRLSGLAPGSASLVLTNPPFFVPGCVRRPADPGRASARVLRASQGRDGALLTTWLQASLAMLEPGGRFAIIHRPDALGQMLAGFEGRLGSVQLMPIYPRERADAIRLIAVGVKGSRAPLVLHRGLVLHDADGRFTPTAEAIHRGAALLDM